MGKSPTPETPKPAPFFPIDIAKTGQDAINADQSGFATSDADFQKRFPGLSTGRDTEINDAYGQLTGALDPSVQSSFVNEGLSGALTAFGGGSPYANVTGAGTAGKKAVSSSVANNLTQKQDYDRSAFGNLLTTNLPRAFGLSGSDAANLSIANTGNLNATNQSNYSGQVASQNAKEATDAANTRATISTAIAIAGIIASFASDKRLKKNIKTVGTSPSGIPIKTFQYKGDNQKYLGAVAQDVEKVSPEAVTKDNKGMRGVRYDMIDVPFMPMRNK